MHTGSCMPVHACRFIHAACSMHAACTHAGSCMPVHACRSMHTGSCQLLLMRACAQRAYCKKMPGQFRVKKLWLAKRTYLNKVFPQSLLSRGGS
jgi:hypothetical protein